MHCPGWKCICTCSMTCCLMKEDFFGFYCALDQTVVNGLQKKNMENYSNCFKQQTSCWKRLVTFPIRSEIYAHYLKLRSELQKFFLCLHLSVGERSALTNLLYLKGKDFGECSKVCRNAAMLPHEQRIEEVFLSCFFLRQFEFCMKRTLNPTGKELEELQHPAKAFVVWKKTL